MFTIAPFSLEEIGRRHASRINVKVAGFWSQDPIQVYISRDFRWNREENQPAFEWKFSVSHSSGGRDTKEVADDLEAEANFGAALIAATGVARALRNQVEAIEAWAQVEAAEREAQRAEEQAAKEAREAADPAPDAFFAKSLITAAKVRAQTSRSADIQLWQRGTQSQAASLTFERTPSGRVTIRRNGNAITENEAITHICETSAARACLPADAEA